MNSSPITATATKQIAHAAAISGRVSACQVAGRRLPSRHANPTPPVMLNTNQPKFVVLNPRMPWKSPWRSAPITTTTSSHAGTKLRDRRQGEHPLLLRRP